MTQKEAVEAFLSGKRVAVVEYRSSKAETINWRDKESNKALTAVFLRHNVEMDDITATVNERTAEGFKPEAYKAPFTKGQKCVLVFSDLTTVKGVTTSRGVLHPLS